MKFNNCNQTQLSKELGIGRSTLSLKLNGHREFKQEEIDVLIKIFNKPYEFLMIRSDKK